MGSEILFHIRIYLLFIVSNPTIEIYLSFKDSFDFIALVLWHFLQRSGLAGR
jgi:hypothetical protein